jgi:glutathione S-transferase
MQTLFIIPGACSFGSMVALEWQNKPYQIGVTTPEIRQSPEFRAINPLGKVGALKDGDTLVYENLAILLYLVDKNPNAEFAIPINSVERIETYKWLSYLSSTLHAAFGPLFHPAPFVDESGLENFKQRMLKRVRDVLAYVDSYLAKNKYFVGSKVSVVDAQAYGLLRWAERFGILGEYKHISGFINMLNEIAAVKNALNIETQQTDKLVNSSFVGYYKF